MTKVIIKKLRRKFGEANYDKGLILIDPRQKSKSYLDTLVHEKLHLMFPEWSETKVRKQAKELRNFLWDNGYRKVDL